MKKIIVLFLIFFNMALVSFGAKKPVQKEEFNYDFFKNFNDEILIENIARAIGNNLDLKIALSKVKESERIVKMSLANELPTIDFEPLVSKTFSSGELRRGANNYMIRSYNQSRSFYYTCRKAWRCRCFSWNSLQYGFNFYMGRTIYFV